MKNIVLLILFLVTLFITNIVFYYNSDYYQNFIKGLKGDEGFVVENKTDLTQVEVEEKIGSIKQEILDNKKESRNYDNIASETVESSEVKELEVPKNTITLGPSYLKLVKMFSEYNLERLDVNTKLFDVTNEYPDTYFEYYSRDLSLYIFPTKTYDEVLDVFLVLEDELPFTVNITNNIGESTFYINLNKNIADGVIRIVAKSQNRVFGLKIKNNEYNNIKTILEKLPTN